MNRAMQSLGGLGGFGLKCHCSLLKPREFGIVRIRYKYVERLAVGYADRAFHCRKKNVLTHPEQH